MDWLRQLPIKRKLNLIVGITCLAVLAPTVLALVLFQVLDFRRALARDTMVLADVLARSSRSVLASQDQNGARQTLLAAEAEPVIAGACLYDSQGVRFASYTRPGLQVDFPEQAPGFESHFEPKWLAVARPVVLDGKRVGTIYLQAGLQGIRDPLLWSVKIGLPVLVVCLVAALALSSQLQRPISQPILALAQIAKVVAERHDYTVRAPPQGRHEIGLLTDAFNLMLTQIQKQNVALKESEERFRLMVSSVEDYAIFGLDPAGKVATWNAGAERTLGYQAGEIIGRDCSTLYCQEDVERGKIKTLLAAVGAEDRFEEEGWRLRKDGSRFWASVTVTALRNPAGQLRGFVKVMRDITERKEAEAALSYERDLLNTLLDNLPDSIYFKDLQSRFVRVSKSKLESDFALCLARHRAAHLGEPAAELPEHLSSLEQFGRYLTGRPDTEFLTDEEGGFVHQEEQQIIRTGVPVIGKVERTKLLDGSQAWFISVKMPWRDKEGHLIGTFGSS